MAEGVQIGYTDSMANCNHPTPNLKYIVMSPAILLAALTQVAEKGATPEDVMFYLLDNSTTQKFELRQAEDSG